MHYQSRDMHYKTETCITKAVAYFDMMLMLSSSKQQGSHAFLNIIFQTLSIPFQYYI